MTFFPGQKDPQSANQKPHGSRRSFVRRLAAAFAGAGVTAGTAVAAGSARSDENTEKNAVGMEPFIGEITMFGSNFAPRGWALCNGQLLPIAQYSALFSLLGTIYGGDGRTTFALPDLRGRFPMHAGTGPGLSARTQGRPGGRETATITTNQIPNHTHPVAVVKPGGANNASGLVRGEQASVEATGPVGGNQPMEIMPPFQTINFIIALEGVFPSRS